VHPEAPSPSWRMTPRPAPVQLWTDAGPGHDGAVTAASERTDRYGKIRQRACCPSAPCPLCGKQRTYALTKPGPLVNTTGADAWHPGTLAAHLREHLGTTEWERLAQAVGRVGLSVEEYLRTHLSDAA
jgi:hypothetical protein